MCSFPVSPKSENWTFPVSAVSLKHDGSDGTDGTGIQSVSPVPSASAAGPTVPSVSNSRSN